MNKILSLMAIEGLALSASAATNVELTQLSNPWPFVILRSYGSAERNPRFTARAFAAQERHPGLIEEIWFEASPTNHFATPDEFGAAAVRNNLSVRDRCRKLGIAFSYQQGLTLGHEPDDRPHAGIPDDAWVVDRDGKIRRGLFCCTSPFARDYTYREAKAILAAIAPDSYWPDDDLRLTKFDWSKPQICFCERCLKLFSERTGRSFDRASLLAALEGTNAVAAVRRDWCAFNGEMLGEFAASYRRAADEVAPKTRLGIQIALDGNAIDGDSWKHMLEALAGPNGKAGIRPGGMYYTDRNPRLMLPKMGFIAREGARSGALGCCGQICYEAENWPHIGANKNPSALMAECAVALAAGCDSIALYWGADQNTQSDAAYDYWFDCVAKWKPLWTKIRDTFRGTALGGLAVYHGSDFFASEGWTSRARDSFCRLGEAGVPITVAEAKPCAYFLDARAVDELGADDLKSVFAKPVMMDVAAWRALAQKFPTLAFLRKVEVVAPDGERALATTVRVSGYERFADGLKADHVTGFLYEKGADVRSFSTMTADPKASGTLLVPTEFGGAVVLVQNASEFDWKEEIWADGRRHAILDALDAAVPGKMPVRLLTDGYAVAVFARVRPDGTPAGALLFNFGLGETPPLEVAFRSPAGEKIVRVAPITAYQPALVTHP